MAQFEWDPEDLINILNSNSLVNEESACERLARDLWEAVEDGNIENVWSLLERKADPDHEVFWSEEWAEDKYPPLHTACWNDDLEIAKELVNAGANVDASGGWNGSTPLHLACYFGYKEVVDYLIREAGCTVDVSDDSSQSPLDRVLEDVYDEDDLYLGLYLINHGCGGYEGMVKLLCEACFWGNLDVVEELVELHRINPNYVRDDDDQSPLDRAFHGMYKDGRFDLVVYLISNGCGDDTKRAIVLAQACHQGRLDVVKELVEQYEVDPKDVRYVRSPLHLACMGGHKDVIEYLVEKANCDVNMRDGDNRSPLNLAYLGGHKDVVEYLVKKAKCDVNVKYEGDWSPLHLACEGGHKEMVEHLLERANCDVNVKDQEDRSPLHLACVGGHKDVVEFLVEKANCDVKVRDKGGRSPLHLACEGGHKDIVEYLVEKAKCDVNMRDKINQTPLHKSCDSWCFTLDVVQYLVENIKCDINVRDEYGRFPLHLVCERGNKDMVEYLVEKAKCDVNVRDEGHRSPLHLACLGGHKDVAQYLVEEAKCDVNMRDKNNQTPLHKSCGSWLYNLDMVQYLVENAKCDVNVRDDKGRTPLDTAIENNTSAAFYLIDHIPGMCDDKERGKLLCRACNSGDLDMVKKLVEEHLVDPKGVRDEDNRSPLHLACDGGYCLVVKYLVKKTKCDVNVRDEGRRSPLHLACLRGHKNVAQYLVEEAKCDVNMRDKNNQTPLHKSCGSWRDTLEVVQYLVKYAKCDINVRDDQGRTPLDTAIENNTSAAFYLINHAPGMCDDKERGKLLCRACSSGDLDMVKKLIKKHKVDPRGVRDKDKKSPLHWACEGGHKRVVEYLVEKGNCDVNVKDQEDRSPLHLACEGGQKDVVEYLVEKAKCDVNVRGRDDSSPLHLACEGGHKGVVKYLVEKANCDVNMRDKNNQTPLHKSCGSWCFTLDMVQCLVENANCDINVSDDKGKTPLDLATERSTDTALDKCVRKKWTKVVDYLKSLPGAQSVGAGQKRATVENHESSPPPSKRPRTQNDVIDDGDMTSLDLAIDTCLDRDQREESLPTEHSAGQKRVSSENHESRPPPSKRPRTQNDSTSPPRRTCPECNQPCDIHFKKCPNSQCGQKLPPIRSCPECNRSCHVRCKKCPHPECGYTFPPTSKSKATGEAKKNPASLLQILQKKVEQLGQNGYNVAVMVHKPNPERDTFNKYSTDGAARDYIDSPDVFNNWKEHFKKSSRAAGTSSGGADTAGTSSGADTVGTSSGGADTAGSSGGGADTAGTSSGGAATAGISLSSDQMSAIVQEVLKQMQKKT